jgi:hypothetical protein
VSDGTAWKLFFTAWPEAAARAACRIEGRVALAEPLLRARAIVV